MSKLVLRTDRDDEALWVDGCRLTGGIPNYRELVESARRPGAYFLLTCGCGEAGCAGIFTPIEVTHGDGKINWHITDPEPERWFEFSRE